MGDFFNEPPVTISVIKTTSSFYLLYQALIKWIIFGCLRFLSKEISSEIRFRSSKKKKKIQHK